MPGGVKTDAAKHIGGVIPKPTGGIAMCCLMDSDSENQRNRINRNGLDRIVSNHGNMISIGAKID